MKVRPVRDQVVVKRKEEMKQTGAAGPCWTVASTKH